MRPYRASIDAGTHHPPNLFAIESKKKIRFGPTRGAASPFRKASSRHHGSELTRATPSNCQARRYRRSGLSPRRSIEVQGLELLRMIRARNESVPIVVLSSRRLQGRFGQGKVVLHNPSQLARFMAGCLRGRERGTPHVPGESPRLRLLLLRSVTVPRPEALARGVALDKLFDRLSASNAVLSTISRRI